MRDSQRCIFFGALLLFFPAGFAVKNGGSYICNPPQSWTSGEKVSIELRISQSEYPRECTSGTNGRASFKQSLDGNQYFDNCTVKKSIQEDCSFIEDSLGCGCVSNRSGIFFVQYNFIAHPDYHRWWKAEVPCLVNIFEQALSFTGTADCDNITINLPVPTTSPPPATTTTGAGHEDCRFCECDREECVLCCVLCILVIILCIIIFVLITTVIILCCCFPTFVKESAKKPDCKYCFCRALFALFGGCINWVISNGSASSPDGRNVTIDKETRMVLTGTSKPEVESNRGADQDGGPSAPVTDREAKPGDKPDGRP